MSLLGIPDDFVLDESDGKITYDFNFTIFTPDGLVTFSVDDASVTCGANDGFIERIRFENLNAARLHDHLLREIQIRNVLDEGSAFLGREKFKKAIERFDEVLHYDENYAEALLLKSRALFGQGHYVKALRYYKRTLKADAYLKDIEYHRLLLARASKERDSFPKIKRFIFTGDEYFSKGDFDNACENYDRALESPSGFKSKILYRLLNKKATALFNLKKFGDALSCFEKSLDVKSTDYAAFMAGFCRYRLGMPPGESFVAASRISKSQLLLKALILKEVKLHEESLKCIDELLADHFVEDKMYFIALSTKISLLKTLDMDATAAENLLGW